MGNLSNNDKKLSDEELELVCNSLSANDIPTAWILLAKYKKDERPIIIYNKALCLYKAGKFLDAMPLALSANNMITSLTCNSITNDAILLSMLSDADNPHPISNIVIEDYPELAKIYTRWLLSLCYFKCDNISQSKKTASPLSQYNIKSLNIIMED